MKIQFTMKTPDVVSESIDAAVRNKFSGTEELSNVELFQQIDDTEDLRSELTDLASKWFQYGEDVTLELDTNTQKITVLLAGD